MWSRNFKHRSIGVAKTFLSQRYTQTRLCLQGLSDTLLEDNIFDIVQARNSIYFLLIFTLLLSMNLSMSTIFSSDDSVSHSLAEHIGIKKWLYFQFSSIVGEFRGYVWCLRYCISIEHGIFDICWSIISRVLTTDEEFAEACPAWNIESRMDRFNLWHNC